ncbi:glycosyltransferase family 25 protein [Aliiglaciecola sp. LCG003]|uniref:glycosyltransferase family 25 protein n=1 Tax=Aliiglaciecola sp. LCG003 TaxID=3053655 RepID=UPI00257298C6|nr:glycosyltransferase family 25 protein [Aliiglaciecola sp. LCG003]WJG09512.1 glycosyltransferase family 25 protein [Aliiglaciecola sp. LCG003]
MTNNNSQVFAPLNSFFDHVYVLTLDDAVDRQENVKKVLEGLNWSFFKATDKRNLEPEKFEENNIYDDVRHKSTKRTTRSMKTGEVACSLSHVRMYQDMLDKNYKRILILEDDVLPEYDSLTNFNKIIQQLPDNWEVLMMGYYGEKPPTIKYRFQQAVYKLFHHVHLFNWHKVPMKWIDEICLSDYSEDLFEIGKVLGTHAYAINQSAARKFIDFQTPVILQADRIFNYYKAQNELQAFALKKTMFTLSELSKESSIQ